MSRTYKDHPRRDDIGLRREYAHRCNVQFRRRVRAAVRVGREPPPQIPLDYHLFW